MVQAYRRFGGAFCRHIQGRRVNQERNKHVESRVCSCFLLAWHLFDPADRRSIFLRNVCNPLSYYTASHMIRLFRVSAMKLLSSPPEYLVLFHVIFIMSLFHDHTFSIPFCHADTLHLVTRFHGSQSLRKTGCKYSKTWL
jgi:hypothetical protein